MGKAKVLVLTFTGNPPKVSRVDGRAWAWIVFVPLALLLAACTESPLISPGDLLPVYSSQSEDPCDIFEATCCVVASCGECWQMDYEGAEEQQLLARVYDFDVQQGHEQDPEFGDCVSGAEGADIAMADERAYWINGSFGDCGAGPDEQGMHMVDAAREEQNIGIFIRWDMHPDSITRAAWHEGYSWENCDPEAIQNGECHTEQEHTSFYYPMEGACYGQGDWPN